MKVQVDRDVCEANGVCVALAPQIFELDDEDDLHIRHGEVPRELEAKVREAVKRCPKQALRILEDSAPGR